jgi:hypothetical protein
MASAMPVVVYSPDEDGAGVCASFVTTILGQVNIGMTQGISGA